MMVPQQDLTVLASGCAVSGRVAGRDLDVGGRRPLEHRHLRRRDGQRRREGRHLDGHVDAHGEAEARARRRLSAVRVARDTGAAVAPRRAALETTEGRVPR